MKTRSKATQILRAMLARRYGFGASPNKQRPGLCGHGGIACHLAAVPKMAQKNEGHAFLRFLRFFSRFHRLDRGFNDFQFLFVQRVQHGINPLSALASFIFGRVKVLIYRYIKHCDHLIKSVKAWVLTVIFVIHNSTGSPVNNICQLLLCHPAGLPSPLDGKPYIVKIKSSFVLFYLHNIT